MHRFRPSTSNCDSAGRLLRFGIVLFHFLAIVFLDPGKRRARFSGAPHRPRRPVCPGGVSQCVTVTIPCGTRPPARR